MALHSQIAAAVLVAGLAACTAQSESLDQPSSDIVGASLSRNALAPDAWSYIAPDADLGRYTKFILEPAVVYRGAEYSYGDLSEAEVQQIAQMFVEETRAALSPKYPIVTRPGPDVARLKFTLVAVSSTVPYVSTATRIIPIGAAINLVKGSTGGAGTLTGGVTYAIEGFDSQTGKLEVAAVRSLTPGAFDIEATLGTMETARAVAKHAAEMLRARLDGAHRG